MAKRDIEDNNRDRRIEAVRAFEELITALCSKANDGAAIIEIHAKKGRLGRAVAVMRRYVGQEDS